MNRDIRDAVEEAKLLRKFIEMANRLDNDNTHFFADEQQTIASARIRYAKVSAYVYRNGETLS